MPLDAALVESPPPPPPPIERPTIRETEHEKIIRIRRQFGLPDRSPLLDPAVFAEQRIKILHEQATVAKSSKRKGFVDRSKDALRQHELKYELHRGASLERLRSVILLRANGVAHAADATELVEKYGSTDFVTVLRDGDVIKNLKTLSPDDFSKGLQRVARAGFFYDAKLLKNKRYVQVIKAFAQAPEEAFQQILQDINLTSLGVSETSSPTIDQDLDALVQLVKQGGLGERQKRLAALIERQMLGDALVLLRPNGSVVRDWLTVGDLFDETIDIEAVSQVTFLMEDYVAQTIQRSGAGRFYRNDTILNSLVQYYHQGSLTLLRDIVSRGVNIEYADSGLSTFDYKIKQLCAIMQNPLNLEWAATLQEIVRDYSNGIEMKYLLPFDAATRTDFTGGLNFIASLPPDLRTHATAAVQTTLGGVAIDKGVLARCIREYTSSAVVTAIGNFFTRTLNLPVVSYLADNRERVDELILPTGYPKDTLVRELLEYKIPLSDPDDLDDLLVMVYYDELPKDLLRYFGQLSPAAVVKFASQLSSAEIENDPYLSATDKTLLTQMQRLGDSYVQIRELLVDNRRRFGDYYKDGRFTRAFFNEALEAGIGAELRSLITPETLSELSITERMRLQSMCLPSTVRSVVYDNSNVFEEFLKNNDLSVFYPLLSQSKSIDDAGAMLGAVYEFHYALRTENRVLTPIGLCAWRVFRDRRIDPSQMTSDQFREINQEIQQEIAKKLHYIQSLHLNIPKGLRVSMGTEIEVLLNGITRGSDITKEDIISYQQAALQMTHRPSAFLKEYIDEIGYRVIKAQRDYKKQVTLATQLGVGKGADAIHEFANRPVTDHTVLLWELYEISRLGFLDFDRKLLQYIEQGMHLTISGEGWGIRRDENADLLQTAMLISGWSTSALDAGGAAQTVEVVDDYSPKLYEQLRGFILERGKVDERVFETQGKGVENRALRINSFEHLARTLRTFHRLTIALKAYQEFGPLKILFEPVTAESLHNGKNLSQMLQESERILPSTLIRDDTMRKLVIIWSYFKAATIEAFVKQQKSLGRYRLENPSEPYNARDMTRLGAELLKVFGGITDTGELEEDSLKGYHKKAELGSLPDVERKLIIEVRSEIERLLAA